MSGGTSRRTVAPHLAVTHFAPLALPAPSILTLSRVELAGVAGRHAEGQSAHGEGAHRAEGWHLALEGNKRRKSASARSSLLKLGWTHGAWQISACHPLARRHRSHRFGPLCPPPRCLLCGSQEHAIQHRKVLFVCVREVRKRQGLLARAPGRLPQPAAGCWVPAHITVSHPGRSWTQFSMYSWVARMLTFLIQYCTTYLSACTSCRCYTATTGSTQPGCFNHRGSLSAHMGSPNAVAELNDD